MNINLQKYNNFKSFVEDEVGLNTPLFEYNPQEFTPSLFMNSVLKHPNPDVEKENCTLFNEGRYFEIRRVLLFMDFLEKESFFLWDVEDSTIEEFEVTFLRQDITELTGYYQKRFSLWETTQKRIEKEKIPIHIPENIEIPLQTPLGVSLQKSLTQQGGVTYTEGKKTIQWYDKTITLPEQSIMTVHPHLVMVIQGNTGKVYYKRNITEITMEIPKTITIYKEE